MDELVFSEMRIETVGACARNLRRLALFSEM
jgi:hypothetical protein